MDFDGVCRPDTSVTSSNRMCRHIEDRQYYKKFDYLASDRRETNILCHFQMGTYVNFIFGEQLRLGLAFQVNAGSDRKVLKKRPWSITFERLQVGSSYSMEW
jgi:hypothetical protein